MRTLGIDLASQAATTAACLLAWRDGVADVEELQVGVEDSAALDLAARADVVGVDAPFGWPDDFVELIARWHGPDRATPLPPWTTTRRDALRFRLTDEVTRQVTGRWPLSVSTDLIALPALRCAGLLVKLGVTDRSGGERAVEVYPAAALAAWGFASRGYKGTEGAAARRDLVGGLRTATPWLRLRTRDADAIATSSDALDALLAALVARAWALGLAPPPPPEHRERAAREGWIALPAQGSLRKLPG